MRKKIIAAIMAGVILVGATITMMFCYEKIQILAKENQEASDFLAQRYLYESRNIETMIYALEYQLSQEADMKPSDLILNVEGDEAFEKEAMYVFNNTYFKYWTRSLTEDPNIHYYAVNNSNNRIRSNDENLGKIKEADILNEYLFWVQFQYDEEGNLSIIKDISNNASYNWSDFISAESKEQIERYIYRDSYNNYNKEDRYMYEGYGGSETENKSKYFDEFGNLIVNVFDEFGNYIENPYDEYGELLMDIYDSDGEMIIKPDMKINITTELLMNAVNDVTLNNPKNMTFTFAVPTDIKQTGSLNYYVQSYNSPYYIYHNYAITFMVPLMLLVLALSLFIPFGGVKEWTWFKWISGAKFEILGVIYVPTMIFLVLYVGVEMVYTTLSGEFLILLNQLQLQNAAKGIIMSTNFLVWFVTFAMVMFLSFMIRYFFNKGPIKYIKENTIVGWVCIFLYRLIKKTINIFNFDLSDPYYKIVIRFILVNLVVMILLCCVFFLGIPFAIAYSILLFAIFKKQIVEVRDDYDILLNAMKKLSSGDFNIKIDEDLGVFNSMKDSLLKTKEGFGKAVHEEVKSQRMKTELISNVSHDLKTPLTSIISYIDLMKQENISDEDRIQYLETIDRNSIRLKNLIDDLFEVSKANSGDVTLHLMDVELVSLIKQVEFECLEKLQASNLELKVTSNKDKVIMSLDSSKTYRIFANLLTNVCKYALPNTRVYIDINEEETQTIITVKNISKNELNFDGEEIQERFVQGDPSRNSEGSGLGLAIVRSFSQLQNGEFNIEMDGDLFKAIVIFRK